MRGDYTRRSGRATVLGLAALLAVACADERATSIAEAALMPTAPELAVVAVPFHADFVIVPRLVLPGDPDFPARCPTGPNLVATVATGSGQATHMGRVTETESNCVDFATLP